MCKSLIIKFGKIVFLVLAVTMITSCNSGSSSTTAKYMSFQVQPSSTITPNESGIAISPYIKVQILDVNGDDVINANNQVTLSIGYNPNIKDSSESNQNSKGQHYLDNVQLSRVLTGTTTVNAVRGIATFRNIGITQPGNGYILIAYSKGLGSISSNSFNVAKSTSANTVNIKNTISDIESFSETESIDSVTHELDSDAPLERESVTAENWIQPKFDLTTSELLSLDLFNNFRIPDSTLMLSTQYSEAFNTWENHTMSNDIVKNLSKKN